MRLPGVAFLRERQALRDFESQDPSFRDLVFYSEGRADWPHLGPVIEALLGGHDRPISYITSGNDDPGLAVEDPRFRAFFVGSGTVRTILFARIEARHFVMTLPDLGSLWLKRSVHPVHYVYLFHSINSTHTAYRREAFDQFDTILCVGPHHVDEIRRTEAVRGLPPKELIEHGSVKLDSVMVHLAEETEPAGEPPPSQILVAPSWGECSLIERPEGRQLVRSLIGAGHQTVLRLHPMTARRLPNLVAAFRRDFGNEPLFTLEDDMNATESWRRSGLMISDWSGAATEFAFSQQKPVVYIDTPQKILNPAWQQIGMPALEETIRHVIGTVVAPQEVARVPNVIADELRSADARREQIREAHRRWIFNPRTSATVAASYLASLDGAQ